MGYGIKAWEIVGYTYCAELLCPACVWDMLAGGPSVEAELTDLAQRSGIDRSDESSYDSDDFPKVVFASSVEDEERCDRCGEELLG